MLKSACYCTHNDNAKILMFATLVCYHASICQLALSRAEADGSVISSADIWS